MKKSIIALLVMALMLTAFPVAMAEEEPVVLSVTLYENTRVEDYKDNEMTKAIEEALNVDLQFHVQAATDYATKLNVAINSGDTLDDIIILTGTTDALIYSWAQMGALMPLTDFYADKELAAELYDAIERTGMDFRGALTMPDGEIYCIPTINQSYGGVYNSKCWYYGDWMEALGAEVPETLDEFCDLLRQVVTTDLNGNGEADEIGMAGFDGIKGKWFAYLMNSFVYFDPEHNFMKVEDGNVSFSFTEDAFREGVSYIANMIAEGLIAKESVTQDQNTWKTMINSDPMTVFAYFYPSPSMTVDTEAKAKFLGMAPMEGPEGVRYAFYNPSAVSGTFALSSTCSNPEKAFKVGCMLISEYMSITTRWGREGLDWDYVSKTEDPSQYTSYYDVFGPYIVVYDDASFWSGGGMNNRSWMQTGPYIRQYSIAGGRAIKAGTENQYDLNIAIADTMYHQGNFKPDEILGQLIYSKEENDVISKVSADLITYVKETVSDWLLAPETLTDDAWEAFKATTEEMGAAKWLEVAQAAYDRTK